MKTSTIILLALASGASAFMPLPHTPLRVRSVMPMSSDDKVATGTVEEVAEEAEEAPVAEPAPAPAPGPVVEAPAPTPVMEATTTEAKANTVNVERDGYKISSFVPRPFELWAKDSGFKKYADQTESTAYKWLSKSRFAEVDALKPLIEKTKARPALLDGTHAGDYGFDPMNYASTDELLYFYMESEVKHARLAMLAVAGFIGAELANPGMCTPTILNGGIFGFLTLPATVFLFAGWSFLEHQVYPAQYLEHTPNNGKLNYQHYEDGPYVAGSLNFDPASLYNILGDDAAGRRGMRELELAHGRTAMLAVSIWAYFEAFTGIPVASAFGILFHPFWAWWPNAFVGTIEFAGVLAGLGFLAYKEVLSYDSLKYLGDNDEDFTFMD